MSAVTGPSTAPRSAWPAPTVVGVMALPLAGAAQAVWIELRESGESAMWLVAGALFLLAPGIGAWAAEHSTSPTAARDLVALGMFVVILGLWLVNVPVRTQPGLYFGGGTPLSGAIIGVLLALAWSFAVAKAHGLLRGGRPILAFVIGAILFAVLGTIALFAGFAV